MEHILDSIVREAIIQARLGEFSRRTVFERGEDEVFEGLRMPFNGHEGRIIYTLGEKLTVVGDCHKVFGIRKRSDPYHIITQEAVERYKKAEKKQRKEDDKRYERELAARTSENSPSLQPSFLTHRVEVKGAEYGVFVLSPTDTTCYSTHLEKVVIQYVHPDAIMNIERLNKTTDLTGEALLKVMENLRVRYNVETGYLNGRGAHNWHYSKGIIGATPLDCGLKSTEKQDNIFQKEFKGSVSVDVLVDGIIMVYAAGEAFRAGIYRLREEKAVRIAEVARRNEEIVQAAVSKF